jgi:large subunit ribosomal protein L1
MFARTATMIRYSVSRTSSKQALWTLSSRGSHAFTAAGRHPHEATECVTSVFSRIRGGYSGGFGWFAPLSSSNTSHLSPPRWLLRSYVSRAHQGLALRAEYDIRTAIERVIDESHRRQRARMRKNKLAMQRLLKIMDSRGASTEIGDSAADPAEASTEIRDNTQRSSLIPKSVAVPTTTSSPDGEVLLTPLAPSSKVSRPLVFPIKKASYVDETLDLVLNMNLDPRKPGQAIRGSISLPHGTGKTRKVLVLTGQEQWINAINSKSSVVHAGGDDIIEAILNGSIPLTSFDVCIATSDILPNMNQKGLPRILGPRGRMPNAKVGTLVNITRGDMAMDASVSAGSTSSPDTSLQLLLDVVDKRTSGSEIQYRADKDGLIHVPAGKVSMGPSALLANVGAIMYVTKGTRYRAYTPQSLSHCRLF